LLQLLVTKQGYFEDGIVQRLRLLENFLSVKNNQTIDTNGVKITFKPNIPANKKEIVDMVRDSLDFVPLVHSLSWLPDVDDPQQLIEQLQEQKDEDIKRAQMAMGLSHDDVEYEEVEDDNS
ncbi:phage portal protein, partial [Arthrospira platensis SPKY2]